METKNNILIAFMVIITGVLLASILGNSTAGTTNTNYLINESLNITNGTATGTTTSFSHPDLVIGSLTIINASSNTIIGLGNFTIDYTAGTITFVTNNRITKSTTYSNRSMTNISYSYYPTTYIKDSTSQTIISLIPLFFILGIVGIGIWMAYSEFKKSGMLE